MEQNSSEDLCWAMLVWSVPLSLVLSFPSSSSPYDLEEFEIYVALILTPGLSKDIQCHAWPYPFAMLANHQIGHQTTSKISCQSAWWLQKVTLMFLRGLCTHIRLHNMHKSPWWQLLIEVLHLILYEEMTVISQQSSSISVFWVTTDAYLF